MCNKHCTTLFVREFVGASKNYVTYILLKSRAKLNLFVQYFSFSCLVNIITIVLINILFISLRTYFKHLTFLLFLPIIKRY